MDRHVFQPLEEALRCPVCKERPIDRMLFCCNYKMCRICLAKLGSCCPLGCYSQSDASNHVDGERNDNGGNDKKEEPDSDADDNESVVYLYSVRSPEYDFGIIPQCSQSRAERNGLCRQLARRIDFSRTSGYYNPTTMCTCGAGIRRVRLPCSHTYCHTCFKKSVEFNIPCRWCNSRVTGRGAIWLKW